MPGIRNYGKGDDRPHWDNKKEHRNSSSKVGKSMSERSSGLFSAEDWMCKSCGNINWARRSICNMCSLPRIQKSEARTGLGGGYNDREAVEYIRRNESDDEYDEFGRRRRSRRTSNIPNSPDKCHTIDRKKSDQLVDEDEEDDEEFDPSKYALDSDIDDAQDDSQSKSNSQRFKPTVRSRSNSRENVI
ncbi:hypothetical protein GJ496_005023 [Pomphorhynchus laevis]|nr:hypothetical protein GJ496_005023 [Pomphorhynchus laevis]